MIAQTTLPRWRGFNLPALMGPARPAHEPFPEDDFRWIADWGFDFVRVPVNYRQWVHGEDWLSMDEAALAMIDRAVMLGERYGLHVDLNMHNAPGYCINSQPQPFNLWKDPDALDIFCTYWTAFARRYKGIPSERLSFNLVNEPRAPSEAMSLADFERVMRAGVTAIREVDPDRLVIIDGLDVANDPVPELTDLDNVAQSCRAYVPASISHYLAPWADGMGYPLPTWPETSDQLVERWNREKLEAHYARWADLARQGVGAHCGEGGAYNRTPRDVVLRWLRDVLDILTGHGIGYALWNLRGSFGVLDSERPDVAYVDWYGHQLDEQLLKLMQEF